MLLDAWAAYFEHARRDGKGDLIEDDEFDLDAILTDLARQAQAQDDTVPPDDWEPAETWEPGQGIT
ncbi:hypothetical protein [uncultured Thiodictyon sp.]|uniref:hypothetical protein n=1 Tax=uncultured Thiodictyon sp. TaxID=1846217 RepID=UPI0025CFF5B2|nr:hypothetical protein [uncultured Thiodictyon sp.]